MFRRGWLALLLLFASSRTLGQGGPPFITDDPGTPGSGHWENIVASTLERNRAQSLFEAPLLDFNYGLGDRVQLKYKVPFLVLDKHGGWRDRRFSRRREMAISRRAEVSHCHVCLPAA